MTTSIAPSSKTRRHSVAYCSTFWRSDYVAKYCGAGLGLCPTYVVVFRTTVVDIA